VPEKRERERKEEKGKANKKGNYRDIRSVASPSFSSHGRIGLDPFCHTRFSCQNQVLIVCMT
jgi:hypothetical protein